MNGIIYTRVSSTDQIDGTSLEFQEKQCRKYCEEKNITVLELFIEEGESAKSANRTQLIKALEFCRKNKSKIDAFVVLRVDRFARNTEDHFSVRKLLLDYGVTLHSVSEPIGNSPTEKFIETVLAASAEFDNSVRSQRAVDGMSSKINQGIYPFRPPLGYVSNFANKRGKKKTEPDPPHPEIFPLIQKALKTYATGLYKMSEIGTMLDTWGLAAIRSKATSISMIERIFGQYLRYYAGWLHNPWTSENVRGLHKPMITEEELYTIQHIREGKSAPTLKRERHNPDFPLKRTVCCGTCEKPFTGSRSKGNGGYYYNYHCYNKECAMRGKSIRKQILEESFAGYLEKITPDKDFLSLFEATIIDLWQSKGKSYDIEAKKHEKRLLELQKQRKRVFKLYEDGSYTKEDFQERKASIESEITGTNISLSEAKIDQFDIEAVLNYATKFISNLPRQWFDLSPRLKPRFQKLIFPSGICYDKTRGFRTADLGLIYTINQHSHADLYHLVGREGFEPSKAEPADLQSAPVDRFGIDPYLSVKD